MSRHSPEGRSNKLGIRVRHTLGAHRQRHSEQSVSCPIRETSTPLDVCASCARCEEISGDASDGQGFVRCKSLFEAPSEEAVDAAWSTLAKRAHELGQLLQHTKVGELMATHVTCVTPDLELEELAALLLERKFSGAPVVDEDGRPIGMVSKTDLVREEFEGELSEDALFGDETVAEVMTQSAFRLPESASVAQAAATMALEGVHRIPIVSSEGKVVGLLTSLDLARWLAQVAGYAVPPRSIDPP